jgi:hypothetical protein
VLNIPLTMKHYQQYLESIFSIFHVVIPKGGEGCSETGVPRLSERRLCSTAELCTAAFQGVVQASGDWSCRMTASSDWASRWTRLMFNVYARVHSEFEPLEVMLRRAGRRCMSVSEGRGLRPGRRDRRLSVHKAGPRVEHRVLGSSWRKKNNFSKGCY